LCMDHSAGRYWYSICLHCDPYTTQTRTQDHKMPYIDYLCILYQYLPALGGTNLAHTFHSINFATLLYTWHNSRWTGGQFWYHVSRPPYIQWNELNIGKLWRLSAVQQYAFGTMCSVPRAFLHAFTQNTISYAAQKINLHQHIIA
jgi:hypothetical protein